MSANYYQVATPKSPHDLISSEEEHGVDISAQGTERNSQSASNGLSSGLLGTSGDSEDIERIKYEMAKSEILDKLNLQLQINHKNIDNIRQEMNIVDAQITLLDKIHKDRDLKDKIEDNYKVKTEKKKQEILDRKAREEMMLGGYDYNTSIASSSTRGPPSASGSIGGGHHYHTRSKSNGHLVEFSNLRPVESLPNGAIAQKGTKGPAEKIPDKCVPGTNQNFSFTTNFNPAQLYAHHKRNYSSTCLTSNSGVVGRNENNEAIFRRYDGILIIITCSSCGRRGFTSAQGIVNHCRLKHSKTYNSQPLAVLNNQILLPEEKQDPKVIEEFKKANVLPEKEYLPSITNTILNQERRAPSPKQSTQKHVTIKSVDPKEIKHLEKMYGEQNDDFRDLIQMVNDAPKDLKIVLEQKSDHEDEDDEGIDDNLNNNPGFELNDMGPSEDEKSYTPSSASDAGSSPGQTSEIPDQEEQKPTTAEVEKPRRNLRKRKHDDDDNDVTTHRRILRERAKPAEKKVRPDVIALSDIPPEDKRSGHYNLRAKSKLRSSSGNLELD
ncbi:Protein AHC1 [Nakaseomyces bracarensis]|uniref:Protein AHC1 n=1 Tax=Nakaseomyces bracarensis TaxID=273131 RepID=A0ABR4NPN9_9SACH